MTVTQIAGNLTLLGFLGGKRKKQEEPVPKTMEKPGYAPKKPPAEPDEQPVRKADAIPETCGRELLQWENGPDRIPPTVVPDQNQRPLFYVEEEIIFLHSDEIVE